MSRFSTKAELIADATGAWDALRELLSQIPDDDRTIEVIDGMSVRDFLCHRTAWSRMAMSWYAEARAGGSPAVPHPDYSWRQLPELNAQIIDSCSAVSVSAADASLVATHEEILAVIDGCSDDELFTKGYYPFTGSTTLGAYFTSATGGNYRSATKHIRKWWRARS